MSLFTGKEIEKDLRIDADVCVIGSGAGGAIAAERLSRAGKRVVVLEEGGYHTSEEFNMQEVEMFDLLYQEHGGRATKDLSIGVLQGRAYGGGTVVNGTVAYRTPRETMTKWAETHGISEITHDVLVPYWERVEQRLNITKIPLEAISRNCRVMWDGCQKLGWQVDTVYRNVKQCASLGYCFMACPIDAKQGMHLTYLPDALGNGADVYVDARVETIAASGRKATEVFARVLDPKTERPTGRAITVSARWVVLAGGGINSPAVLLRSKIGNKNGRVGKRTFLHPVVGSLAEFEERIEPFYGATVGVGSHQWAYWGSDRKGFFMEVAAIHPAGGAMMMPGFGLPLQEAMDRFAYMNVIGSLVMDGFDAGDFDEGAGVFINERGAPVVDYKWSEKLCAALREGHKRAAECQFAAGAKLVRPMHGSGIVLKSPAEIRKLDDLQYGPNLQMAVTYHQMGGCAMGPDPQKYVVDERLRHHEFDNLYIIDGSVFPTSLGVNSQHSIYGLAAWAADRLVETVG